VEKELNKFFTSTLVTALENLKADSKAEWGTMTAKQMLLHLTQSSKMMHLGITKLLIKEKYTEKAIAFLYTDKPISRGIEIPKDIGYNFDDGITENIEQLKDELIESANTMLSYLTENTDFKAIHPFFGELTAEQWLLFQKKHFTHHLSQFDLL
jgi:oxepin-CoA hydrolase/3-oxo-5,6-dehydrosuberyl-CoA semialdehyde dehydrogenase